MSDITMSPTEYIKQLQQRESCLLELLTRARPKLDKLLIVLAAIALEYEGALNSEFKKEMAQLLADIDAALGDK